MIANTHHHLDFKCPRSAEFLVPAHDITKDGDMLQRTAYRHIDTAIDNRLLEPETNYNVESNTSIRATMIHVLRNHQMFILDINTLIF
jgi:hypothetical protein